MKGIQIFGVLLLAAGGVTLAALALNNSPPEGRVSLEASGDTVDRVDAASWISRRYITRQNYVESHPEAEDPNEWQYFVPPEYADQVAACVVRSLNANPRMRQWRSLIPIVQDIQNSQTDQYTQSQISQGNELAWEINNKTVLCKEQIIPSGALQGAYERHREAIRATRAQIQAERRRQIDAENARLMNERACHERRYMMDWYCSNSMGQAQDPSGQRCQEAQQSVAASGC